MLKTLPEDRVSGLCDALGLDCARARHRAELCSQIFTRTFHLHGLTRTARPLLELAAILHDACAKGDGEPPDLSGFDGALERAFPELTATQRRIVFAALRGPRPEGRVVEPCGTPKDAVADEVALRMAAIIEIADGLSSSGAPETSVASAIDDGEAVELLVSGGGSVRRDVAAAAQRLGLWNLVMLRPIRTIAVFGGKRPPGEMAAWSQTVAGVARRLLQTQWEQFTARLYGLSYDEDIEYVHEMRVALRRLRAALRVFRRAVDGAASSLGDGLRQLANALGAVRDIDVLLVFLRDYSQAASDEHRPYLRELLGAERRRRRRRYRALEAFLASEPYAELRRTCSALLTARGAEGGLQSLGGEADEPLSAVAPRILLKGLRRVTRHTWRLDRSSPEEQHGLRILCKKLRYTAEFFSCVYPEGLGDVVKPMVEMQDSLGDVHDADLYKERILRYHARRRRPADVVAADQAAAALLAHLQCWREESLRRAMAAFKAFLKSKAPRKAIKAASVNGG